MFLGIEKNRKDIARNGNQVGVFKNSAKPSPETFGIHSLQRQIF